LHRIYDIVKCTCLLYFRNYDHFATAKQLKVGHMMAFVNYYAVAGEYKGHWKLIHRLAASACHREPAESVD